MKNLFKSIKLFFLVKNIKKLISKVKQNDGELCIFISIVGIKKIKIDDKVYNSLIDKVNSSITLTVEDINILSEEI